jgi:hypothetical protein
MEQFYENFEDAWDKSVVKKNGESLWNHNICWKKLYSPSFMDSQMALLRKAKKEIGAREPYKWRIEKMLRSYEDFERNSQLFRRPVKLNPLTLNVPFAAKLPVFDGKVDAKEWANAAAAGNFLDSYAVYPARGRTEVRLMHDKKFIYLGIKASADPGLEVHLPDEVWGKRDPALWYCDSVECFFGIGTKEYYQFILAYGERVFDAHFSLKTNKLNAKWTSKIEMKSSRSGNNWEMEARIPLSELQFAQPGKPGVYRVNFTRNHFYKQPGDRKYQWEQTGWQPSYGAFSNTDKYGTMILK